MADSNIQSVIAKVQKLLALTGGSNNENECKAARAAADRLIQEYRLTQAQLESQGSAQTEPFARKKIHEGGRRNAWQEVILAELCAHFGGCWYFTSRREGG